MVLALGFKIYTGHWAVQGDHHGPCTGVRIGKYLSVWTGTISPEGIVVTAANIGPLEVPEFGAFRPHDVEFLVDGAAVGVVKHNGLVGVLQRIQWRNFQLVPCHDGGPDDEIGLRGIVGADKQRRCRRIVRVAEGLSVVLEPSLCDQNVFPRALMRGIVPDVELQAVRWPIQFQIGNLLHDGVEFGFGSIEEFCEGILGQFEFFVVILHLLVQCFDLQCHFRDSFFGFLLINPLAWAIAAKLVFAVWM